MSIKAYQEEIIRLYETQERRLALLYAAFAERFPPDRQFWGKMGAEEARHAAIVAKLKAAAQKGAVLFDAGKVKTDTLTAMIDRIESLLEKARRGPMDRTEALSLALDMESSLIEKQAFTHFAPLTEKARAVLKRLNAETLDHVGWVRSLLSASRAPSPAPAPDGERLVWTDRLSVNDPRLDGQHRLLFDLINDLADLRRSGASRDVLLTVIQRMIAYSDAHFGAEDEVMIDSDFPDFGAHRLEHQHFLGQIRRFVQDCAAGQEGLPDEMMAFLKTWWFEHTARSDRRYALWIQGRRDEI